MDRIGILENVKAVRMIVELRLGIQESVDAVGIVVNGWNRHLRKCQNSQHDSG